MASRAVRLLPVRIVALAIAAAAITAMLPDMATAGGLQAATSAAALIDSSASPSIAGTVHESGNLAPLGNLAITAVRIENGESTYAGSTYTDAAAGYQFFLPPGTYVLATSTFEYEQYQSAPIAVDGLTTVRSDILMQRVPGVLPHAILNISVSAPTTLRADESRTMSVELRNGWEGGPPLVGEAVAIWAGPDWTSDAEWSQVATVTTSASGGATWSFVPERTGYYRAIYPGGTVCSDGRSSAVQVSPPHPTNLTMSVTPSSPTTYGQAISISGLLTSDLPIVVGTPVSLERYASGKWVRTTTLYTHDAGMVSYSILPYSRRIYRLRYLGHVSGFRASTSTSIDVYPLAYVGPVVGTRYAVRSYKLRGSLKPRHTAGGYPVRIYLWRLVSGKWKPCGYIKARASDCSDYTTYRVTYKFPSAGKWRLRAYHPADSGHAATWSSYSYIYAK